MTTLEELMSWTKGKFLRDNKNALPNGIIYLKGGEVEEELLQLGIKSNIFEVNTFFKEAFFGNKEDHLHSGFRSKEGFLIKNFLRNNCICWAGFYVEYTRSTRLILICQKERRKLFFSAAYFVF